MQNLTSTNLELFGTDTEVKLKELSSQNEEAWKIININEPGLYIWRIEKFIVVAVNKEDYGTFYEGDSYIILNICSDTNSSFKFDAHFWLGSKTTQDEMGVAAYKTVELDNFLHGKVVQYRELQFNESDLFKTYFTKGIQYKVGGIESGFHNVSSYSYDTYKPILYLIQNNSISQIPLIISSLIEDDVFVLDNGLVLYVYKGVKSSHKEKYLAECTAQTIQDNRKHCQIVYIDKDKDKDKDNEKYNTMLDIIGKNISELETIKIHRIVEDNNKISINEVSKGNTSETFNSNDSYVVKTPITTYIWVGNNSNYTELHKAWQVAFNLTKKTDHITLIKEGNEPDLFVMFLSL